ncbi:MAG TPA: sialidase family protein [Gemmatimonadaceae bacterium]|nr:sialidase family protein [Gemmatimonadaceae bacterium]
MRAFFPLALTLTLLAACGGERAQRYELAESPLPVGADATEPDFFTAADGRVVMSWIERVDSATHALRIAIRGTDGSWGEPRDVTRRSDFWLNWADFPSVAMLADGRLLAHWPQRNGSGRYAYEVRMAESRDEGRSWSESVTPHRPGIEAEHGFVSILPMDSGALVVFLDGGNNLATAPAHAHGDAEHATPMTLAANRWGSAPLSPETKRVVDARVCDCCQTSAALAASGPVVVYRDRSTTTPEIRDIVISRFVDGAWSDATPVHADNWEVDFCPVNGPMVQAYGDTVVVAWFTAARDTTKVQVAFSYDGGATFGAPTRVDDGNPAGRVGLQLFDGAAYLSWLERGNADSAFVKLRRVARDGSRDSAVVVSPSSGARSSGFPRMTRIADGLLLAWTVPGRPSAVRGATYRRVE